MKRKSEFNEKLIITVEEVLREAFGEAGLLVYTYLESQSVMREEIPERLEAFSNCLKNFSSGGPIVEAMILKNLYSRFGLELKENCDGDSFTDQIDKLRNSLQH